MDFRPTIFLFAIRDSRKRIAVKKDNGFTDYAITTYLPPSEAIPDQLSTWNFQI